MGEASKTRRMWDDQILQLMKGRGIDIGCGNDPVHQDVERFDQPHGDANHLSKFVDGRFDYVFSSHSLEHMRDPIAALKDWFSVLKPKGHLIVIVPDEDLYEQGHFPSIFNNDHKSTFTIWKKRSWSPRSFNVLDLPQQVGGELVSIELHDLNYDRALYRHGSGSWSRRLGRWFQRLRQKWWFSERFWVRVFGRLGATIDQTSLSDERLAQIQFVIKKNG